MYWKMAAEHDAEVCTSNPGTSCSKSGLCGFKAHDQNQNYQAVCQGGACGVLWVPMSPLSLCSVNDDCVLHHAACCATCVPDVDHLIALAKSQVGAYSAEACNPEVPETCPSCAPTFPEGAGVRCNPKGHCEVVYPQRVCPETEPVQASPCAHVSVGPCDYGDGLPGCRDRFTCPAGVWKKEPVPPQCATTTVLSDCPTGCLLGTGACDTEGALCLGAYGALWKCDASGWVCQVPGPMPACPGTPPYNGQPCDTPGLDCRYGWCEGITGMGRTCQSGVWVDETEYCLPLLAHPSPPSERRCRPRLAEQARVSVS